MQQEERKEARYDVGDRVAVPAEPNPHDWKIIRVGWSSAKGTVYDLERGEQQRIAIPEDEIILIEGGARIF